MLVVPGIVIRRIVAPQDDSAGRSIFHLDVDQMGEIGEGRRQGMNTEGPVIQGERIQYRAYRCDRGQVSALLAHLSVTFQAAARSVMKTASLVSILKPAAVCLQTTG